MPNANKYIIDVANIRPGGRPIKGLYVGSSEKKYATLGNKCIYDKVLYELSINNITNVEPNAQTVTISSYTSKRTHGNGVVDTLYINPSTKQVTANTSTANTKDTTVVVNQALTLNGTTTGTGVTVTITQIKDYPTGLTLTISPKSTIPAAGGSISSTLTNYTYSVKANYKSGNNNVDVTSNAATTITANVTGVTASSKGTTASNATTAGTIRFTASYTCNGKTVTTTTDVNITQDKNEVVSYANPTFTLTPSSNQTLPASGGRVTASVSNVQQVRTWSSTSTDTFSPSYTTTWNAQTISCDSRGTVTGDALTLGTTTATVTANGKSISKSYVVYQQANAVTNSDYNASNSDYWASCSIGDGLTAAGGSASVSASAGHTHKYYYLYTSQSTSGPYYSYPSDGVSTSMIGNGNSRFSYSNGTISHSSMGTNVTTDTVTIRATNNANGSTADASKSISNAVISTTWGDITGTPTGSCSDIPAGGGTVTATTTTPQTLAQNYKYNYTSGSQDANWKSTNVSCHVSYPNGNTATASSLGTTVKDRTHVATLTVRASANGKTKDGYVYVYQKANDVTSTEWGDLSLTAVTLSCGDVPARGGTVTPSWSGTAKQNRRYQYTSGSYTAWELVNITPTVSWSPTSKTGNNLGQTDKVRTSLGDCTATFTGNSSKTATKAITVYQEANTHTDSWNSPVVTITYATFSAAGETKTPTTCSATQSGTRTWTSGSQTGITNTNFTWGNYNMTNGTGFTLANASTGAVTAESRGTTTGASRSNSTIRIIATGAGSKQGTGSGTVTQEANAVTNSDYNASNTNFWASCSIGDGLTAAGGSATVTANAGHTHEYYYLYTSNSTSGPYYSYPSDDVSTSMVTNGNNRFSYSNGIISHSSMGADVTTDTVTIAAANYVSKSGSTASKEIVNKIESTIWGDITVTVPSNQNVTSGSGSYILYSGNTKAMQIYTYAYTSESRSTFTKNYYPSYKGVTWSVASNHTGFTTGTTVISGNNVVPKIVIGDSNITVPKISWDANNSTASRSATITVSCTANGKTGSNSFTITQAAGVRYQFTIKNDSPYGVYGEFGSITPTGQSVSGDFPTGTNRTVDMVSDTVIINNYLGTVQGKTSGFVKFLCTGGGGSGSISGSIQSNGMVDATGTITIKNGSGIALDIRY